MGGKREREGRTPMLVRYMLKIAADLENLTDLQPEGGCNDRSHCYYFKIKCERCMDVTKKEVCVRFNVVTEYRKKIVNLRIMCKECRAIGTITMAMGKGYPLTKEAAELGKWAPLMLFDCTWCEPMEFAFGRDWKAISIRGRREHNNINLAGGMYRNEAEEAPVKISNLRSIFVRVK